MAISNEQLPGRSRSTQADEALRQDLQSAQNDIDSLQTTIKTLQAQVKNLMAAGSSTSPVYEPPLGDATAPGQFLTDDPTTHVRSWQVPPSAPTFIVGELPSGAVDGTNRVFTTAHAANAGSVAIYVGPAANTLTRIDNSIFGYSGSTITFTLTNAPALNSFIRVDYNYGP